MCKHLRFSSKVVGYAGTKDKRGVTSQWCTVKRKSIEELRTFNRPLGAFQVTDKLWFSLPPPPPPIFCLSEGVVCRRTKSTVVSEGNSCLLFVTTGCGVCCPIASREACISCCLLQQGVVFVVPWRLERYILLVITTGCGVLCPIDCFSLEEVGFVLMQTRPLLTLYSSSSVATTYSSMAKGASA